MRKGNREKNQFSFSFKSKTQMFVHWSIQQLFLSLSCSFFFFSCVFSSFFSCLCVNFAHFHRTFYSLCIQRCVHQTFSEIVQRCKQEKSVHGKKKKKMLPFAFTHANFGRVLCALSKFVNRGTDCMLLQT